MTVGINVPDVVVASDTATYLNYFDITQTGTLTVVPVNGGAKRAPQGEATLDVETISALAPAADILFYQWPNFSNTNVLAAFNAIVSDDAVSSVSNSWGGAENQQNLSLVAMSDSIFQEAIAKGIEFIFASGDNGAYADGTRLGADWPASDPNVTALGGIHITVDRATGAIAATTATWLDTVVGNAATGGSGGGVSRKFPLPPYQWQVAAKTTGRNVPDVSLVGDIEDAAYAGYNGGWYPTGGTSWAAPSFNALLADIESQTGRRTGFVNPAIYFAYGWGGGGWFVTDVVRGNNGINGLPGYRAVPHYDLASGLGTVIGTGLLRVLQ